MTRLLAVAAVVLACVMLWSWVGFDPTTIGEPASGPQSKPAVVAKDELLEPVAPMPSPPPALSLAEASERSEGGPTAPPVTYTARRVTRPGTIHVSGRVLYPGGAGVPGQAVVITDADGRELRASTDARGVFAIDEVSTGWSLISLDRSRLPGGWVEPLEKGQSHWKRRLPVPPEELDFVLVPGGLVRGRVIAPAGLELPGDLRVRVFSKRTGNGHERWVEPEPGGQFQVDGLFEATYAIHVESKALLAAGVHIPANVSVDVFTGGASIAPPVQLGLGRGSIIGSLTEGAHPRAFRVALMWADPHEAPYSKWVHAAGHAEVDDQGRFAFEGVGPGEYFLVLQQIALQGGPTRLHGEPFELGDGEALDLGSALSEQISGREGARAR